MMEGTIIWLDDIRKKHKEKLESNKKEDRFNGRDELQGNEHKEGPRE